MVIANIVCGTFFTTYSQEGLKLPVKCPIRDEVCTFQHLQGHLPSELSILDGGEEALAHYLGALTRATAAKSAVLPAPHQKAVEIVLGTDGLPWVAHAVTGNKDGKQEVFAH